LGLEPEEIITMSGQRLPMKCSVDYISFSAHTDYQQTSEFIRALKPPHIVSGQYWCSEFSLDFT
jgi:cleavage and polyadenylation specificity factor subunit 3